ncbi:hypothetical protein TSAR_010087 [Trichomalopsis sarcophagae]|uniref:Odorant receptor n=1 Tax=Trichomalopsis sarcophagae TaxID=543379 RepID=A0A232F4U7_9HYME|nr:hypothetical protein TSAR_010087 [Trichomalopsis sarcophagae]
MTSTDPRDDANTRERTDIGSFGVAVPKNSREPPDKEYCDVRKRKSTLANILETLLKLESKVLIFNTSSPLKIVLDHNNQTCLILIMKSSRRFWNEFKIYKFVLWPCGVWPSEKRSLIDIFFYLVATISQIFIATLVSEEIYGTCGTPADLLDYYAFFVCFIMSFIKLLCMRLHFIKMYRNCLYAQKNWTKVVDTNVLKIMQRYANVAKKFYHVQMFAAICVVSLYVVNPFILPRTDASNLPIQTVCSFRNLTDWEYVIVYVVQSMSLLYLAFGFIGVDVFFFGIVMHLCAQLKILQIEFNTVGKLTWRLDNIRLMALYSKKHYQLIMLANDLKTTFSATFFIALKINNKFLALKSTQAFPILFLEVFLYCYAGQLLQYEFSNITNSIYNSRWYALPPKLRQYYLLFGMTAGNKAFRLTAGQLVNVDMRLFIYFVKTIFSFFSLLLLMFDKRAKK